MTVNEIHLSEGDSKKLQYLLETHNKGLSCSLQMTMQQYVEELLRDAIYFKYKMMKSD